MEMVFIINIFQDIVSKFVILVSRQDYCLSCIVVHNMKFNLYSIL